MAGNQNSLITIGIPIYNVSLYLSECLDSILSQTYTNLEIILVDDGSMDNSGEIADKYAELDQRVRVVHKKNEGLAAARNTVASLAKGEFITFIDSDDLVSKRYVANLYRLIIEYKSDMASIAFQKFVKMQEIEEVQLTPQIKFYESDDIIKYSLGIPNQTWGKIYKTNLIKETLTFVNPFNQTGEDNILATELLKKYKKVVVSNEKLYYYRENPTGISNANNTQFPIEQLFTGNRFIGNRLFVEWCASNRIDLLKYAKARLAYAMCLEYNIFVSVNLQLLDYKIYRSYMKRLILGNLLTFMMIKEISLKVKLWFVASALFPKWLYKMFKKRVES